MERDSKIALGLFLFVGAAIGGSILYNRNKKPKIESYDNINKTVTYTFRGSKKTTKLDPSMATEIGRYSITPMLDALKQVMGAEIKDESGTVIDSMYSTPSSEEKVVADAIKKTIGTVDASKVASALMKKVSDERERKEAESKMPSSSDGSENLKPIFPVLSPPQVGAKEWNNVRKLSLLLDKKTGKKSWITRESADANTNKKLYNNFHNYVTYDEYLSIGKFLGTYKGSESKTKASMSNNEVKLLSSGIKKIRA